jgi:hypothetical protein
MTYTNLKLVINGAYATFGYNYVVEKLLGVDMEYSDRQICFVKCLYKTLMNQNGDENIDLLTKVNIQNCITLFNEKSNSIIPIEYT